MDDGVDIWLWDLRRRSLSRLTTETVLDLNPAWTPDGARLVWMSGRASKGGQDLFVRSADGSGPVEQLTQSTNAQQALDVTPDGQHVIVGLTGPRTGLDLMLFPLNPRGTLTPLLATPFDERHGKVSPDGRWLAYDSNESGQIQVIVRPFPQIDAGKWQVSTGGGKQPLWARNGRELFYRGVDGSVMGLSVETGGGEFRAGIPSTIVAGSSFLAEPLSALPQQTYDVLPDGRFLMIQEGTNAGATMGPVIVVVQNLVEALKALALPLS
jgi:serine/threonine-protein kinase